MKKVENLNDRTSFYASDQLLKDLQARLNPGDTVVNVAYTDYGGDFFDKVLIQYFEEKHPDSIIVESAGWNGYNAFIFGAIADELIESTDMYLLGFENLEDYYSEKEADQEREDFTRFLNDLDKDKYTVAEDGADRLYEKKAGGFNITTQGVDFSERDLIEFCLQEGIITEIVETEE
jgi:NAD(P)H-flavin reductase